jgi:glutamate/aspartate transport system substrate-binding protein
MKKLIVAAVAALAFAQAAVAADTLGRIKAAKTINVAFSPDSLPFSYAQGNEVPRGYSIDLCKRVITQISRTLGVPDLQVRWLAGTTPERLQMIASGKADLDCANTSQTLARLANVDFSALIFLETGGFLGRADTKARRLGDMGGKKIAVLKGTTTEKALHEALQKGLVNAEVVPVEKAADGMAMLASGTASAFAGDTIKLVGLVVQEKDPDKYALLPDQLSYETYAMALPRNDSAMRLEVNRALSQVYRSGDISAIYGQWLAPLGKPTELLTAMYLLYSIPE